jgi:hypothetical protein
MRTCSTHDTYQDAYNEMLRYMEALPGARRTVPGRVATKKYKGKLLHLFFFVLNQ